MFESVYVICLPHRKNYMQKLLGTVNFKNISENFKRIIFVNAVEGKKIDSEYLIDNNFGLLKEFRDPYSGRRMTAGEVGCVLSHFQAWKNSLKNKDSFALVLEDDIQLADNFEAKFKEVIHQLEDKKELVDLLYLGRKKIDDCKIEEPLTRDVVYTAESWWACGYMISNNFASSVINSNIRKSLIPADNLLSVINNQYYDKRVLSMLKGATQGLNRFLSLEKGKELIIQPPSAFKDSNTEKSSIFSSKIHPVNYKGVRLKVVTVATHGNCALDRFKGSCHHYGVPFTVLGMGKKWSSGNLKYGPGGAQKIFLLKEYLDTCNKTDVILFTDSYDVVMNSSPYEIVEKFKEFDAKVVFSSEYNCWPDQLRAHEYPVTQYGNKFLNSGGFIGKAEDISKLIDLSKIKINYDDQRYYTTQFLNDLCSKKELTLDYECRIFQTLNSAFEDVKVDSSRSRLYNLRYRNYPCVLHGNGPAPVKIFLNGLCNFLTGKHYDSYGRIELPETKKSNDSKIYVDLFLSELKKDNVEFFNAIFEQTYDKSKIDLNITCKKIEKKYLSSKLKKQLDKYSSVSWHNSRFNTILSRKSRLSDFKKSDCDYYFLIENQFILNQKNTFEKLIKKGRKVISPMMKPSSGDYPNFWYTTDGKGDYVHNPTQFRISLRESTGVFNVSYVYGCFMMQKSVLNFFDSPEDLLNIFSDMKSRHYSRYFCRNLREKNIFMYIDNSCEYGSFYNNHSNGKEKKNNLKKSLIQKYDEKTEAWEKKYLCKEFLDFKEIEVEKIAGDIYTFPFFSDEFCKEIISMSNELDDWEYDRHANYPTTDILVDKIFMKDSIKSVYEKYLLPLIDKFYALPQAKHRNTIDDESFIVKYSTNEGEQSSLDEHTDNSIFTIMVCLNKDFEGGGTFFPRQGIDKIVTPIGSVMIFPGRLTHPHAGLPITSGKRYVLVSFCN